MRICVFGTGYVGLVQAAVLAEAGHAVICVDIDEARIRKLVEGEVPIYEPGLEQLVRSNLADGRLSFSVDAAKGLEHSEIIFIAVGTPQDKDGSADVVSVLDVARTIGKLVHQPMITVTKSTVPVGTTDRVRAIIEEELAHRGRSDLQFDVASNPEFLKEGSAVADCMKPDRIIMGVNNSGTEKFLRQLYAPFNRNRDKIIVMDVRSAELTKYAANSMLASRISLMNELAALAERVDADIEKVRQGIGSDPRIGYHFIYPGAGYGGACFPKDLRALIRTSESLGLDPLMLRAVEERNERQKLFLFERIMKYFDSNVLGRTFAVWGLAFKPNTDDMREAPSRVLMECLWQAGAVVRAYDPKALKECQRIYGSVGSLTLCSTQEQALEGADALVIVTEWKNFHAPDFDLLARRLKEKIVFDGRNIYDPITASRYGLKVVGVGRSN